MRTAWDRDWDAGSRMDGHAAARTQIEAKVREIECRQNPEMTPVSEEAASAAARDKATNETLQREGDHWLLSAGNDYVHTPRAPGIVPALENGIAIISYLNRKAPRAATLAEMASTLGISRSHCHSLLKTLTHFEWLSFDDETKKYRLQSGILSDTSSLLNSPTISVVRPLLTELVDRLELPCVLPNRCPTILSSLSIASKPTTSWK